MSDNEAVAEAVPSHGATCSICGKEAVTVQIPPEYVAEAGKVPLKAYCAWHASMIGEDLKKAILAHHSAARKEILDRVNADMVELFRDRLEREAATAWVTVVDARRRIRGYGVLPPETDLRFLGGLFRSRGWERVPGVTAKNSDEGNHGRPIDCWRYVGEKKAEKKDEPIYGEGIYEGRGPGGPMTPEDYPWVRGMRKDGKSLDVIASYFEPPASIAQLRKVLAE